MSHLTPYNFVVAGESPYVSRMHHNPLIAIINCPFQAYLFDRRHSGRRIQEEWGVESSSEDLISCVRRFGRKNRNENEMPGHEHITGSRMSQENGHEVLNLYLYYILIRKVLIIPTSCYYVGDITIVPTEVSYTFTAYSADGVYLYSTRDPPEQIKPSIPALLASNKNSPVNSNDDVSHLTRLLGEGGEGEEAEEVEAEGEEDEETDASESSKELRLPVVLPRRKFVGACNIETVKDGESQYESCLLVVLISAVNFIGLQDEYIVSGSDDGKFFVFLSKPVTDEKQGISSYGINIREKLLISSRVMKVLLTLYVSLSQDSGDISQPALKVEQHPFLPILAVSGIDETVKVSSNIS